MIPEAKVTTAEQAQLRQRVARVLETGFRMAVAILAAGLLLSIFRQEALPTSVGQPREIARGIADGAPGSFIGLGIMTVILTPFLSTIVMTITFYRQGNRRYAGVCGLVLLILLSSIGLSLV